MKQAATILGIVIWSPLIVAAFLLCLGGAIVQIVAEEAKKNA